MRKLIILIFLVGLTALAGDTLPRSKDVGRYRLLRAPVTYVTPKGPLQFEAVFKIDSMTGDTWMFKASIKDDKKPANEGWWFVSDLNGSAHMSLDAQLDAFLEWAEENKGGTSAYTAEQIAARRRQIEQVKVILSTPVQTPGQK